MTSERATQDQLDPLIGTDVAGRYRIVSRLGEGGMGVVYEGVHEALGRSVAIKILRPAWASDTEAIERFFREARTAAGLGHPNICDVYDLGRLPNERPYMVMPKLEGQDLGKLLYSEGPMAPERVLELMRGPASALDTLHKRGLVHRDLKPENLVLGTLEDGQEIVRLVDFGLATLADGRDSRLTREGFVCGTPHYMPPEAARGDLQGPRGDIYSLAVVAYELIAGVLPFDHPNPLSLLAMKVGQDAPLLSQKAGVPIPEELDLVFQSALATDPSERPATAGAFVRALANALGLEISRVSTPKRTQQVPWKPVEEDAPDPREVSTLELEGAEPAAVPVPVPVPEPLPLPEAPHTTEREEARSTGDIAVQAGIDAADRRRYRWAALAAMVLIAGAIVVIATSGGSTTTTTQTVTGSQSSGEPSAETAATEEPSEASAPAEATPPTVATEAPPAPSETPPAETVEPRHRTTGRRTGTARASAMTMPERVTGSTPEAPTPTMTPTSGNTGESAVRGQTDLPPVPERDPERARELSRQATSALVSGRIPHAVDLYRAATLAHPGHAPAWRGLGLAYEQLGQRDDARRAFDRYLRLVPDAPDAADIRARL